MYSFTRTYEIFHEACYTASVATNRANTEILTAFDNCSDTDELHAIAVSIQIKKILEEGAPLPPKVLAALERRRDAQVSAVIEALEQIVGESAPLPQKEGRKTTKNRQAARTLHEVADELIRDIAFRTRAFCLVAKDMESILHAILDGVCARLRSPDYTGCLALAQNEIVPRQRPQHAA